MSFNKKGAPVKAEVIKHDIKKVAEELKKKEQEPIKKDKPEQPK